MNTVGHQVPQMEPGQTISMPIILQPCRLRIMNLLNPLIIFCITGSMSFTILNQCLVCFIGSYKKMIFSASNRIYVVLFFWLLRVSD